MGRRTALLIAAVLIAVAGTALILMYVQGIDARATQGQTRVEVLVATETIPAGEKLSEAQADGKIDTRPVVKNDMVAGALVSADSIKDRVAVAPIYPGEQLIAQKFGKPGDQESVPVPAGTIAISVNLSDPARVANFLTPGSRVAIFLSTKSEITKEPDSVTALTRLLLPEVQVVGVGETTVHTRTVKNEEGQETTEEVPRTILTIAVNQNQAEKVIFGAEYGELTFALRNDDSELTARPGVTSENVIPEAIQ